MAAGSELEEATQRDLFGLHRLACQHPDCPGGCTGFLRLVSRSSILDPALLLCSRCGCPSSSHARSGEAAADCARGAGSAGIAVATLAEARDAGLVDAGAHATVGQSAVCWTIQGPGVPPVSIGDLVHLPTPTKHDEPLLGVVRELQVGPTTAEHATCRVSPLSTRSSSSSRARGSEDVFLPARGLKLEEFGTAKYLAPPVVERFEEIDSFHQLVYQPAGVLPFALALRRRRCKICTLGGSISLQRAGYRSGLVKAFERRGIEVEDCPLSVGTAGSKPLALVAGDRVATERPNLLLVEVAVNDGDELLEGTPLPDVLGLLRAAEGIVRTVKHRSPGTTVVFLEMFLRDDAEASRTLKSGAEAWRDTDTGDAIGWYHDVAPRLHRHVCRRYGLAQLDLIPAMRALPLEARREWFRDDCHTTEMGGDRLGALVAKLLLWAVRQPGPAQGPVPALCPVLDRCCWCDGRIIRISSGWLTPNHTIKRYMEKDPMRLGEQAEWLLLGPGGQATIPFKGSACGLMTVLGPDAPVVRMRVDGGPFFERQLLDHWCYYWRDAVVLLCEGLTDATHTLYLEVVEESPDRRILKRAPTSPFWVDHLEQAQCANRPPQRLWLLYACAVQSGRF